MIDIDFSILTVFIIFFGTLIHHHSGTDLSPVQTVVDSIETKVDTIDTVVDDIHVHVDSTETKVNTVDTVVDGIDTVVDAINAKIPQMVRGHFSLFYGTANSVGDVSICNITGSGKLNYVNVQCVNAADSLSIRIFIDGITQGQVHHTGDTIWQRMILQDDVSAANSFAGVCIPFTDTNINLLNLEFDTSLEIKLRRLAGTADIVKGKVCVSVDNF